MQDVAIVKAAYEWMVEAHEAEVATALGRGDMEAVERLAEKRDMLERGVFVVLFGQFEKLVSEYFEQARDVRIGNPDWTTRRGWDVPTYVGRRVPFETKLAMVLDRKDQSYGKIMDAYARRNHCAHGGTSEAVASIDQLVGDLYTWQAQLRK